MPKKKDLRGYTLVICEKPDAAKRVAVALTRTAPEALKIGGVVAFKGEDVRGKAYVVCAAAGHLYGVADTIRSRVVYPVADLEWFPLASGNKGNLARRIRAIETLSRGAASFVNACDLDVEGETIGYNILRYACGGKESSALRARFSSLTGEEVAAAFAEGALRPSESSAMAGRLRHVVDFLWGVNLSRALSEATRGQGSFRTLSIGRVQGPTLNFIVQREVAVRAFLPTPYWTAEGRFSKDGLVFEAKYSEDAIETQAVAQALRESCEGREGVIAEATERMSTRPPPPPFNLAELQKEAFRSLGYTPSKTLQTAERLYLAAMISYPRTWSQKLPKLDFLKLLMKLASMPHYSGLANVILSEGVLRPREGANIDPAHPAIYPTGESARRSLGADEKAVFDLIVRRFLSCFGEDAIYVVRSLKVVVGEHRFEAMETTLKKAGWIGIDHGRQLHAGTLSRVPSLNEGDRVRVEGVTTRERLMQHPPRYDQATLLEKMERERIGTKATRADVISTLLGRGYVSGASLTPTELGFSLVEAMEEYCPQILSTTLTREVEEELERVEALGEPGLGFFERTLRSLFAALAELRTHKVQVAERVQASGGAQGDGKVVLGGCPVCKTGKLWVVRSRKTGKRFVGCTNYPASCSASAPLPQRGTLKTSSKACGSCGWPVVYVRFGRRPWRLCVNNRCPEKVNVYSMVRTQKGDGGLWRARQRRLQRVKGYGNPGRRQEQRSVV